MRRLQDLPRKRILRQFFTSRQAELRYLQAFNFGILARIRIVQTMLLEILLENDSFGHVKIRVRRTLVYLSDILQLPSGQQLSRQQLPKALKYYRKLLPAYHKGLPFNQYQQHAVVGLKHVPLQLQQRLGDHLAASLGGIAVHPPGQIAGTLNHSLLQTYELLLWQIGVYSTQKSQ